MSGKLESGTEPGFEPRCSCLRCRHPKQPPSPVPGTHPWHVLSTLIPGTRNPSEFEFILPLTSPWWACQNEENIEMKYEACQGRSLRKEDTGRWIFLVTLFCSTSKALFSALS